MFLLFQHVLLDLFSLYADMEWILLYWLTNKEKKKKRQKLRVSSIAFTDIA